MNKHAVDNQQEAIGRAIAHVKEALAECDQQGFVFAAIDLASALDKLVKIRAEIDD
jgi:hypothetical protein